MIMKVLSFVLHSVSFNIIGGPSGFPPGTVSGVRLAAWHLPPGSGPLWHREAGTGRHRRPVSCRVSGESACGHEPPATVVSVRVAQFLRPGLGRGSYAI